MKNAKKVESFIRSIFEVYGLDYNEYFSTYTADDGKVALPMVIDGKLDMTMVHRAAEILGEDVEDLLSMNDKKTGKWQIRFPYIYHKHFFEYACKRSYYGKDYDTLRLMEVLWDFEYPSKPLRYDYKDVKDRMLELLKEYDKAAPGIYHAGADIKHLHIDTTTFCHYAELEQMMTSFFEMVDRAKALFFKALEQGLSAEEAKEYNITASVLGIRDRCISQKGDLHYDMLRKLSPVYKAEQQADFFDYVMLDPAKDAAPWRCAEFLQDLDMVQAYANIIPGAKKAMREYALLASQFHCSFVWSDAAPMTHSAVSESEMYETGRMLHFIRLRNAYGGLEPTSVYVPKTAEELGEDGSYADILKELAGPVTKGGIAIPPRQQGELFDISKMMARLDALGGRRNE